MLEPHLETLLGVLHPLPERILIISHVILLLEFASGAQQWAAQKPRAGKGGERGSPAEGRVHKDGSCSLLPPQPPRTPHTSTRVSPNEQAESSLPAAPSTQTAAGDQGLGKEVRKALALPSKKIRKNNNKFRGKLLRSSRQSADGSWQIPQHTVTSKMASCKLFLPRASTRSQEPSPRPRDVSPLPHEQPRVNCTRETLPAVCFQPPS